MFNYKDGVHMIDSDEDKPGVKSEQNILTWMVSVLLAHHKPILT